MQIIIIDSNSEDRTIDVVNDFVKRHLDISIKVISERERKGKSAALNNALKNCDGDVIVVSDADCFWPADILNKALPYLADTKVAAVSGPKVLLNPDQTWVTRSESQYMKSHNLVKLGESKTDSTVFFEGGFSAYKRETIESFDPHKTGADDTGTVIKLIEKNLRTILIPEAEFFTVFPETWKGKMGIKARRANQLIRVFVRYTVLLFSGRVKKSKRIILQNVLLYLVSPIAFILLLALTVPLVLTVPYLILLLLLLLIPRVRSYSLEVIQSYFLLFLTIIAIALGKKMLIWGKPSDRPLLTKEMLLSYGLI
jgi:cellulose synthase/poly-beta-1,6-N-acetylglucosamine synthase-like glycosyltransferase